MQRKIYPFLTQPAGPYVHAVVHGGLLHVSGQTALGSVAQQGDTAAQTRVIMEHLSQIAEAEGTSHQGDHLRNRP